MKTTISDALNGLATIRERALRGAERGLATQEGGLVQELRATSAHGDQTGATRAGYSAGVVGPTLDTLSNAVRRGAADVARYNRGHEHVEAVGDRGAAEVVLILTCPTDYQKYLSGNNAGARDALGPTLKTQAGRLAAAAARGIAEELR